jgi:hypothetical protein
MLAEVTDMLLAGKVPEKLLEHGFEINLLGGQERISLCQIHLIEHSEAA